MGTFVPAAVAIGLILASAIGVADAQSDPNVTTFHNSPDRRGLYVVPGLTWKSAATMHLDPTFSAPIPNEHVYAQPLYYLPPGAAHGLVIIATMSDTVRAFDADTGAQAWQATLGTPVPSSALPCSGQNPWGIAGTPVIDAAAGAIYFDAEVMIDNAPKQRIFGLSLKDGSVLPGWPVDMDSALAAKGFAFSSLIQDQRGGLALEGGNLYVAYGGHGGDCDDYHGWVVGLKTSPPGIFGAWATRGIKGGIWSAGGVTFAADGTSLFVTTGNTIKGTTVWSDGEAVIRLDPTLLTELDFFAPADWQNLDQHDLDLGGTGPLPIDVPSPTGKQAWLLQLGKDGNAYLLNRSGLGNIGGQLAVQPVSTALILSAPVAYGTRHTFYVAFTSNGSSCVNPPLSNVALTALAVTAAPAPTVSIAWCASLISTGTPIVTTTDGHAAPIVWLAGVQGDGLLHGYAGDDGHVVFNGGGGANRMAFLEKLSTILVAEGRLYIAGSDRLYAFSFVP